tara:strand:+ start:3171 stop:4178 length:1008 start_codon:yes stop_codon:yes gene_type:complete
MNRKLALIVCTYQRAEALNRLLASVAVQSVYPDEILIIDGSLDEQTHDNLSQKSFKNLRYFKVEDIDRGLTRQRNYGIKRVKKDIDIVAFLDDDTILLENYFEEILKTYKTYPQAIGVGGYITNEVKWRKADIHKSEDLNNFYYDGYCRKESSRFKLRRKLGLVQKSPPGFYPDFGHCRSIGFLPPSGKIYQTETLMGGVSSFPLSVLKEHKFSEYFEGYGLYEDADFSLRLSNQGNLYINTAAQLEHHHDASGRPDMFRYGKMVIRNGWYVWRVKYPNPSLKARSKWNVIALLLTLIRFTNVITTVDKKGALIETVGRFIGYLGLLFRKPRLSK